MHSAYAFVSVTDKSQGEHCCRRDMVDPSEIRRYQSNPVRSLAENGRMKRGSACRLGDLCAGCRRRQPLQCGQIAAEFVDVGQPPDFGVGGTLRDAVAAADDPPPRADGRWPDSLRASQIDPW